jgi:hypothetical protein
MPDKPFRYKVMHGLSGLMLLAVVISLLWVMGLDLSYLGLIGEIKVAHIRATPLAMSHIR